MKITLPEQARRPRTQAVPPAGWHPGRIEKIAATDEQAGAVEITWNFRAGGRRWKLPFNMTAAELGHLLRRLGLDSGEIDTEDAIGTEAQVYVRTYGGRRSARIREIEPLVAA